MDTCSSCKTASFYSKIILSTLTIFMLSFLYNFYFWNELFKNKTQVYSLTYSWIKNKVNVQSSIFVMYDFHEFFISRSTQKNVFILYLFNFFLHFHKTPFLAIRNQWQIVNNFQIMYILHGIDYSIITERLSNKSTHKYIDYTY